MGPGAQRGKCRLYPSTGQRAGARMAREYCGRYTRSQQRRGITADPRHRRNTRTEQNTRSRTRPRRLRLTKRLAGAPGLFRWSRADIPAIGEAPAKPPAARSRRAHKAQRPTYRTRAISFIAARIAGDLLVDDLSPRCRYAAPANVRLSITESGRMVISGQPVLDGHQWAESDVRREPLPAQRVAWAAP